MDLVKFRTIAGAAAFAGMVAGAALSVQAAGGTGFATVSIIAPIAITKSTDLAFASIVASGDADTVVVSPAGARSCGGTLNCTGTATAGAFAVTGGAGATYAITLPASATVTFAANTMTVDTFTSTPSGTGTLTGGAETLRIGARLQVGAGQALGGYTGTYAVTVEYN